MSSFAQATLDAIDLLKRLDHTPPFHSVSARLLLNAIYWLERDLYNYLQGAGQ